MSELVGRFDTFKLDDDQRIAAVKWITSLGLNADELCATVAITRDESGYQLHVSRVIPGEGGNLLRAARVLGDDYEPGELRAALIDVARNDIVTAPVVVPLGAEAAWPHLGLDLAEVAA